MSFSLRPDNVKILSVGELTRVVQVLLEEAFPSVWVAGEISNWKRAASGHIYLTLKDSEAQIRAVMWKSSASRLRFDLKDGLEVIAGGRVSVYLPRGEYQLVIEELEPKGLGALELALRQLKEKLAKRGYFAPERKKPIPHFPRRVALVTSPSGAAVRDMLEIFARRWPALEVWICPVRVQGEGAGLEIAAALQCVNRLGIADVVIVGRGGGSAEDLWAFNEECVADAIFASAIPVVSAVGHEIDLTIADLVADRRALTPSEAAELVTPDRHKLHEYLSGLHQQLRARLFGRLDLAKRKLEDLAKRRVFRLPMERVQETSRMVDELAGRLQRAIRLVQERGRQRVAAAAARLEALSPLNVLGRGYSLTRRATDLAVVRNVQEIKPGELLVTYLQHGRVRSRVEDIEGPPPPSR
jgi:exodeoxyribonuclease VII large subunit